MIPHVLIPGEATLAELEALFWSCGAARLTEKCTDAVKASAGRVADAVRSGETVYGVNTGFGKLAQKRISDDQTEALQRNLILSHACGTGAPIGEAETRLMMALKLLSLGRGASGVQPETVAMIEAMLEHGVIPVIPGQGSVGASGDLAPLAHMAAVMIGEGEAVYQGQRQPGGEALKAAGLTPLTLQAKEGLALINGTQFSTALALSGLFRARRAAEAALVTGALSLDAAAGSVKPFRAEIHALRGQPGQIRAARILRDLIDGSDILKSHKTCLKVQDPYCLRCQPQVMGACLDVLDQAAAVLEREANAVTDNPLVLENGDIISGGNFHAEPVAFAADQIAMAVCEIGSISERRVALLTDPNMSDLPAFLTPDPGINSGFMIAHVTAAALVSENKSRAFPASVDTIPTSANQEDHVSMAAHGARRLIDMTDNLAVIIGIEALAAAQGVHLRRPLKSSDALEAVMTRIRADVPALEDDRYMAGDQEAAKTMVATRALAEAADIRLDWS